LLKEEFKRWRAALRRARRGHRRISAGVPQAVDRKTARASTPLREVDALWFDPKPTQKPHPPLWIGGRACRRCAARRARRRLVSDPANPQFPLDTLPRYKAALAKLARARARGRPRSRTIASAIAPSATVRATSPRVRRRAQDLRRHHDEIAADIRGLRDLGVSAIDFRMSGATLDETLTNMRRFRETSSPRSERGRSPDRAARAQRGDVGVGNPARPAPRPCAARASALRSAPRPASRRTGSAWSSCDSARPWRESPTSRDPRPPPGMIEQRLDRPHHRRRHAAVQQPLPFRSRAPAQRRVHLRHQKLLVLGALRIVS